MSKKVIKTDAQVFAEDSFKSMAELLKINKDLKEKVKHLEDLLKNTEKIKTILPEQDKPLRKPLAEEIIEIEIKRIHDAVVHGETLVGTELRKFDTLVKDLVALKGKENKKKKDKDPMENKTDSELLTIINDIKLN